MHYHSPNLERWAANTLRVIGIILTSIVVVCGCLFLVLLSECAAHGGFSGSRDATAATNYMFGAVLLGIAGIAFIAWLGRGIARSSKLQPDSATSTPPASASMFESPGRLSPSGQSAMRLLVWAILGEIAVSVLTWIYSMVAFRQVTGRSQTFLLAVLATYVLYLLPYAILSYLLLTRVSRIALAFALAIPAASVLEVIVTKVGMTSVYLRSPVNLTILLISLAIDLAIAILAARAAERTGLRSTIWTLLAAGVAAFAYFYALHLVTPMLYRLAMK